MPAWFLALFRRSATQRDELAKTALHGILTGPYEHLRAIATSAASPSDAFATASYEIADAMLKARATGSAS